MPQFGYFSYTVAKIMIPLIIYLSSVKIRSEVRNLDYYLVSNYDEIEKKNINVTFSKIFVICLSSYRPKYS